MLVLSLPLLPFMFIEKLFWRIESSWSWWLSAYVVGRWLMRWRTFDLIYSTGGAYAAHLAGAALQRATGVPWMAEIHDPMVVPGSTLTTPQQKKQAQVEGLICGRADVAIWFTEQALASARKRYPELGERGKAMVPGVDPPTLDRQPYRRSEHFVIAHFGSLARTRNLVRVVAAVEQVLRAEPALRGVLQVHTYGGPMDALSAQAIAASGAKDAFVHFGRLESDPVSGATGRDQIAQRMRSADVLLLLHGTDPLCAEYIPSKLYEYLWMQRRDGGSQCGDRISQCRIETVEPLRGRVVPQFIEIQPSGQQVLQGTVVKLFGQFPVLAFFGSHRLGHQSTPDIEQ
jgi:hypothetical protein